MIRYVDEIHKIIWHDIIKYPFSFDFLNYLERKEKERENYYFR